MLWLLWMFVKAFFWMFAFVVVLCAVFVLLVVWLVCTILRLIFTKMDEKRANA